MSKNDSCAKDYEWIKEEGELASVGITDFAQNELGDIVFVNLPEVNDEATIGESFGDVESVKTVAGVNSSVTGIVAEINESLLDELESLNSDPYGSWFIKVEDTSGKVELMDEASYGLC